MSLLATVASRLDELGIDYCAIGAAALAAHGVSRSTQDIDLFTTDARALDRSSWSDLPSDVRSDVRRGDAFDALLGVVRFTQAGEVDVDLVVGKFRWQSAVVARALPTSIEGVSLRVAAPAGLILLKLHAGGAKDAWDIAQLLPDVDASLFAAVEEQLPDLPDDARALWERLLAERER